MKLAEGKPLRRRLMAAMAQQDCGQCGYHLRDLCERDRDGSEQRLNLCVPGEKITARGLKVLLEESAGVPAAEPAMSIPAAPKAAIAKTLGYSRSTPVDVTFLSRRRLNKEGSDKATYHIEFDLVSASIRRMTRPSSIPSSPRFVRRPISPSLTGRCARCS